MNCEDCARLRDEVEVLKGALTAAHDDARAANDEIDRLKAKLVRALIHKSRQRSGCMCDFAEDGETLVAMCEAHKYAIATAETRGWNAAIDAALSVIKLGGWTAKIERLRKPAP